MNRTYLYAPGHSSKLVDKVFHCGADAVILDLEDSVPPQAKDVARVQVREALERHAAFVRINAVRTADAERDLESVRGRCDDIKIPKVESPEDLDWVADRMPGVRLHPILETARGVLEAQAIAEAPGVAGLSMGLQDLSRDLGVAPTWAAMLGARMHVVLASAAAGLSLMPVDSAFATFRDLDGLRQEAESARELGFFGKVAVHPSQVAVINEVFAPTAEQIAEARAVLAAFEASDGEATRTPSGVMVDRPVAQRARQVLAQVEGEA